MNTDDRAKANPLALSVEKAQALVEKHGSQREAAASIGMPQSTFHGHLHPTRRRERYAADTAGRERHQADMRERYWGLSGLEYNRLIFRQRRNKALIRMAQRNQRKAASG